MKYKEKVCLEFFLIAIINIFRGEGGGGGRIHFFLNLKPTMEVFNIPELLL